MEVLVHYGDLALKGKNRGAFIERLATNIERATGGSCEAHRERIIMRGGDASALGRVFGVSWYAPYFSCSKNMDAITEMCLRKVGLKLAASPDTKSFAVFAKRADKDFPVTSSGIQKILGEKIRLRFGLRVDIGNPDLPVHIRMDADTVRLHFEKHPGAGGLPVGASAPLLCLLSGGIDSPVAALLMMKRGCAVDFLHFHVFADTAPFAGTKMPGLLDALGPYQPSSKVFLTPYRFFQEKVLAEFPPDEAFRGYELVLFRRFMLEVACSIASRHGYSGLVTGDSIGQVASQTVENIGCVYTGLDFPVLSPLLGWDKDEIVKEARRAGTYAHSTLPYNECCSLVSPSPRTRCRAGVLRRLSSGVEMDGVVSETLSAVETLSAPYVREEKSETG